MKLIDTHAHLDDERFAADLPDVLERARAAGVERIVAVATTLASTRRCIELANTHEMLRPSAGIHPNHAAEAGPKDWDEVARLAATSNVVALGETGLDRHWAFTPLAMQEDYFARHLDLARRLNKAVIIHSRECDADMLRVLRAEFDRNGPIRGIMHSFTGGEELARACLDMGLYLSFAGMVTYKNAGGLRTLGGKIPADRILVETDCPYLAPVPHRGKRNEPAFVAATAQCLAEARGEEVTAFAVQTSRNARCVLGL